MLDSPLQLLLGKEGPGIEHLLAYKLANSHLCFEKI